MTESDALIRLGRAELTELSARASTSPRRRMNRNLHASLEEPVHRLLNALEPGTYVRPHRHLSPPRTETLVALAGSVGVLTFDDAGSVLDRAVLSSGGPTQVIELPPGAWHTLVSLEPGTVLFEVKPGPYVAPAGEDVASWAPAEGRENGDRTFLATWRKLLT